MNEANQLLDFQIRCRSEIKAAKDMITCLERQTDDYRARQRLTYYRGMEDAYERMLSWVVLPNTTERNGVKP